MNIEKEKNQQVKLHRKLNDLSAPLLGSWNKNVDG
jgi:hypothetical protein